jgi:hypothetical protein
MRADKPRARHEIWPCKHWSQVLLLQRPIFWIMESDAPLSFSCMAPEVRRECGPILKQVTPLEPNHGMQGCCTDATGHLCQQGMLVRRTEAQRGIGIAGITEARWHKATSCRFAWAHWVGRKGIVVQHSILLTIVLLVVEGDSV